MLSRLKFTAKSTLFYSLGSIGIKLVGLILLPVYTDKLTTEQYGMWSLLEVTSQIFLMTFGLRLSAAMLRFYASEKEQDRKANIIFTAFWASFLSVIVFNLTMLPFSRSFSRVFFDTGEFANYFSLLVLWTSFEIFNRLVMDLIRVKERPGLYITVTLVKFTFVLLVIIYLILKKGMGIEGIILGQLLGSVLLLVITLPFVIREMHWKIDTGVFKEMFRYGFPLIFSGIATYVLTVGDRYLIKIFLDYHEVGVYSLSYKFSNLIKLVFVQAFQLGFLPIAFNMFGKPDAKRFFVKIFTYYVFLIFWIGLALSVFSRELVELFSSSESYYEAYKYIPLLTLAISFFGIQNFFMIGLHYARKTQIIAYVTIGILILYIGMNVILIPRFGLYGSSITFIASGILMAWLNYLMSQKYYPLSYELKKILIILLLASGLYLSTLLISDSVLWIRIPLKGALVLLFPFFLYLFNFYERVEIDRIIGAWRKWRNPATWLANLKDIAGKQDEIS